MQAKPRQDPEVLMSKLREGINSLLHAIQSGTGMTSADWMELYDHCFQLCTQEKEVSLYKMVAKEFEGNVKEQLVQIKKVQGEELLKTYMTLYRNYKAECKSIAKICAYLHRFWIPNMKNSGEKVLEYDDKVRDIFPLALVQWKRFCYGDYGGPLRREALNFLDDERNGQPINRNLVREFVELMDDVRVDEGITFYENGFEKDMLQRLKEYYIRESTAFLATGTVSDYMERAEHRIATEEASAQFYYESFPTTFPKLQQVLNAAMIDRHFDRLQESFQDFIQKDQEEDMRRFYFLFSRVENGLANSAETFMVHLKSVGASIIDKQKALDPRKAIANAIEFIKELIRLHHKYLNIIRNCFQNDVLFQQAMDKAFTEVINLPTGRFTMARLLSYYVDHVLRGKLKIEDHQMEDTLDEVSRLFSYFQDKDSFSEYIRKSLCKRLLASDKNFNEAAEQTFISKLKAQCGNNYTRHLQGMFTDINDEASKGLVDRFKEHNGGDRVDGLQLEVQVLNESHWPISGTEKFPLALSSELTKAMSAYDKFYGSTVDRRKLRWLFNHGNVQMGTSYNKGRLTMNMTPLQACILQLFNDNTSMTFDEIMSRLWPDQVVSQASSKTGAISSIDTLKFALAPLCFTKDIAPIRRKHTTEEVKDSKGAIIYESDKFEVRSKVKTQKRRVSFAAGSAAKDAKDAAGIEKHVLKQREFEVDAAMVRIMKTRNVLNWNELQTQVVDALKSRFRVNIRMLKKRLESLIEREFMERDEANPKVIKYVA